MAIDAVTATGSLVLDGTLLMSDGTLTVGNTTDNKNSVNVIKKTYHKKRHF